MMHSTINNFNNKNQFNNFNNSTFEKILHVPAKEENFNQTRSSYDSNKRKSIKSQKLIDKYIYIEVKEKKLLVIKIDLKEEVNLTSGWLLSESIRKIQKWHNDNDREFDACSICCLATKDVNLTIDYLLTQFDRNVSSLKDGQILYPIYKGFYEPKYTFYFKKNPL